MVSILLSMRYYSGSRTALSILQLLAWETMN
jgi:hypothetical protein